MVASRREDKRPRIAGRQHDLRPVETPRRVARAQSIPACTVPQAKPLQCRLASPGVAPFQAPVRGHGGGDEFTGGIEQLFFPGRSLDLFDF